MSGSMWVGWAVVGVLAVLSIVLLLGKGSFLIAGYNTARKEEKEKYDVKKLCRVMGAGLGVLTIITGINVSYGFSMPESINWLMPWGYLSVIVIMVVLANTICKKGTK